LLFRNRKILFLHENEFLSTKTTKIITPCHVVPYTCIISRGFRIYYQNHRRCPESRVTCEELIWFLLTQDVSSATARDMAKLTSEMESAHRVVLGNGFLDGLERVPLQNSESEPFSFAFFETRIFKFFILWFFCVMHSCTKVLYGALSHYKSPRGIFTNKSCIHIVYVARLASKISYCMSFFKFLAQLETNCFPQFLAGREHQCTPR